ncbi:hypothetical protein C8J57DRAFT_1521018 [Mycena rebaudengoi]|nr:hypothetical protein C8J57DRAFT_1521018 [Mycena rebaudengoi]
MAGKQLGKLRQWVGEVVSSRDKTTVSDEFKELEKDVELRRDGVQRLFLASEAYQKNMAKRKDNEALDDAEKLLPIDTLGIVMIIHGEEFGTESAYGNSLVTLGRAHCKVAKLQESYAQSFQDTFLASLVRFKEDIKEYEALRKKLESRRLSYDAAIAKNDKLKSSKKERERTDAEEEMERAKLRYEETAEEVEAHMHAIQETEIVQMRELTSLLSLEITFVEQYLDVLKDTRADWTSDSLPTQKPTHAFPPQKSKFGSTRSKKSAPRTSESSEDEEQRPSSRPSSRASRPASRASASRKRSDSTGTAGGGEKDKRRLSMAGWASSAVGSVTGLTKKNRDKETFASLQDDAERDDPGHADSDNAGGMLRKASLPSLSRRTSAKANGKGSGSAPKLPTRATILPPPSQAQRKVVRALYDFSGSADELTFRTGDQIVVVNEVLDGWWMGELNGRQGLFPTPYTEVLPSKPPLPKRAGRPDDRDETKGTSDSEDYMRASDDDEDANELYGRPLAAASNRSPFYGGPMDTASIVSSVADDDDDEQNLMSSHTDSYSRPAPPVRRSTTSELLASVKKAPPPPPPRRSTASISASSSPLIPDRRLGTTRSIGARPGSAGSGSLSRPGFMSSSTPASSESSHDRSPFDSLTEISSTVATSENGCREFKQNPFKPKGMCSNCFEFHG